VDAVLTLLWISQSGVVAHLSNRESARWAFEAKATGEQASERTDVRE
jgi:hypothetical protein